MGIVRLVLVTSKDHPHHKLWLKLTEKAAEQLGLEYEVRYEDYLLLTEHGDTDELGMAWLPQLLGQESGGGFRVLLSRMPLNKALQPDLEEALRIVLDRAKSSPGE